MNEFWQQCLARQRAVLKEGRGRFLVFPWYSEGGPAPEGEPYAIEGQTATLSEEFLQKHAYDLGIQAVRHFARYRNVLEAAGGDAVLGTHIDWGTGACASLFTGRAVSFQEGTAYSTDTVIKEWDDIDRLRFDPDNRWVQYELQYWRGVASAYVEGLAVTPHLFRSPLDLANDLRGNRLFEDMYLAPEQVERLVGRCAELIIECDRHFRAQIPLLRQAPGGVWSMALPEPGILGLNGDPVDLISPEMGERFNHPYIERLVEYAGDVYFHHHTLGVSRVSSVAGIRGLTVQQFTPDPKCPRVYDILDETWVEASRRVPIDIWQNLLEAPDVDAALERMSGGRFIIRFYTPTLAECRRLIERIRRVEASAGG